SRQDNRTYGFSLKRQNTGTQETKPGTSGKRNIFMDEVLIQGKFSTSCHENGKTGGYSQHTDLPFIETGRAQPARSQENPHGQTKYPNTHQTGEEPEHKQQSHHAFDYGEGSHRPP